MTDDISELDVDDVRTDTVSAKEGDLDQVVQFIRSHNMPDAHMSMARLVIETENTTIEITASDDDVELREIQNTSD